MPVRVHRFISRLWYVVRDGDESAISEFKRRRRARSAINRIRKEKKQTVSEHVKKTVQASKSGKTRNIRRENDVKYICSAYLFAGVCVICVMWRSGIQKEGKRRRFFFNHLLLLLLLLKSQNSFPLRTVGNMRRIRASFDAAH